MKETVDAAYRALYKVAYRMMKVYWLLRQPDTHGALVAVWHEGRVLLVQNSYAPYMSIPGGYVRAGETGLQAAVRELAEEVGVRVEPEQLVPTVDQTNEWEGKRDHVEIFTLELDEPPTIDVDNREVVSAAFFAPEQARRVRVFPPVLDAIEAYVVRTSSP